MMLECLAIFPLGLNFLSPIIGMVSVTEATRRLALEEEKLFHASIKPYSDFEPEARWPIHHGCETLPRMIKQMTKDLLITQITS